MVQKDCVKKGKIYVIGGPTAIGKSNFAIECALRFNGEIVGADSMQIYKGLNIGTGKITQTEMRGIAHHMIDIVSPAERYSVGRYVKDAKACIDDILSRGKLPIVVGGTGLYINAILNGLNLSDTVASDVVREKWKNIASQNGKEFVYEQLQKVDPLSAEKISPNDLKRVIRALEIFEITGKPKSQMITTAQCDYDYRFTIIIDEREQLYNRINSRVDKMFDLGLVDEVSDLLDYAKCQSMQAIGYKQLVNYFNGQYPSIDLVKDDVKRLSRNYAKRQLTFFRGIFSTNKNYITISDFEEEYKNLGRFLNE